MTVVIASKKYITAIPARIIVVGDVWRIVDIRMMAAIGISEKTNALMTRPHWPVITVIPEIIARLAPNDAPEDIPVVYGSAKGFFITLCIVAPATARHTPTTTAMMIIGSLRSMMMKSLVGSWMFPVI